MENSKEALKNLQKELRQYWGSMNEIASRRKCSTQWVRQVLKGEWRDDDVVSIAAQVLIERKQQRRKAMEAVQEAVSLSI